MSLIFSPRRATPVLLLLVVGLVLAGCGGAASTPTPLVLAPTATSAPVVVPSNTSAPPPTSTTAAAPPTNTAKAAPPTNTAKAAPPTNTTEAATGSTPAASPTAEATDIDILEFTDYTNSSGTTYVIGMLENKGTKTFHNITVEAELRDKDGTTAGTGSDLLLTGIELAPGQRAPFQALITGEVANADSVHVHAQWEPYDPSAIHIFDPAEKLTIEGDKLGTGTFGQAVQGRVKNGGTADATLVHILAIGYDADGKFVDVADSYAQSDPLMAGSTSTFKADFERPDVKVAKYELLVDGYKK